MLAKRMISDARRASEIIERIRNKASQRAPEHKPLPIDDIINVKESLGFLRYKLHDKRLFCPSI